MLSEIFYWVLNTSIIGSVVGLIVLVLRKIKPLPRFAVYLLWIIPLSKFWIPFGFANKFSLLTFISRYTTKTVTIWQATYVSPEVTTTNSMMLAKEYFPIEFKTNHIYDVIIPGSLVWVTVAAIAVLIALLLYVLSKKDVQKAVRVRDNIYKSDKITAPAVYGLINPRIIIPETIDEKEIDYIIMHEKVHIHRQDNFFRIIGILTACLHWFNPLVWIFLKKFFIDMELACDSCVLKALDKEHQKEYAASLLSVGAGKAYFTSAFGGNGIKQRIHSILSYKKLTLLSSLFFTFLIAAVIFVLLTNASS